MKAIILSIFDAQEDPRRNARGCRSLVLYCRCNALAPLKVSKCAFAPFRQGRETEADMEAKTLGDVAYY